MAKKRKKSTTRKKKKTSGGGLMQSVANFLAGLMLSVCLVSIGYGVMARHAGASSLENPLRIEVLNGTGESGLANRVAAELRRRGVDVFKVENADNFDYAETILVQRREGVDVEGLADELGCDNLVEQLQGTGFVDATLILGSDYARLRLAIEPETDLPEQRK